MTNETIDVLNELTATCCDGAKGFREAAEAVEKPELKRLLRELSSQRSHFVDELQHCMNVLGAEPEEVEGPPEEVDPVWVELREAVEAHDPEAILVECVRGEDHTIAAYRDALAKLLEPKSCSVVRAQALQVQASNNRVRELRDGGPADPFSFSLDG